MRRLVSDLHKRFVVQITFSMTTEKFVEFEEKRRKLSSAKGVYSGVIWNSIVMFIKVWVVLYSLKFWPLVAMLNVKMVIKIEMGVTCVQ